MAKARERKRAKQCAQPEHRRMEDLTAANSADLNADDVQTV
jgi:hypothetical protein